MRLIRNAFQSDGILGVLLNDDEDQIAVTLEHSFGGQPKLPAGQYRCQRGIHRLHSAPDHPFETFEVENVPGHTGILFHAGNWNDDSDGCILLGRVCTGSTKGSMVTQSQLTFARFMNDLEGVQTFPLTVEDGIPA